MPCVSRALFAIFQISCISSWTPMGRATSVFCLSIRSRELACSVCLSQESDRKQKLKQAETQNTKLKNLVALLQKEIAGLEASPAAEQNEQSS